MKSMLSLKLITLLGIGLLLSEASAQQASSKYSQPQIVLSESDMGTVVAQGGPGNYGLD
ncbi:hypothetical protein HNR42_000410 [Deinobacterium chartae]|uniref:Uncharacterized protein n=1 Tax=Deinobacterium chartae TaxID=521158 RepID=A0A841HYI3_9DEIO|nr:hypothetical protein [Deinobacterium chartae]MBB6096998.1 hypothetical protein [Deinobacterium chartae]